MREQLFEHAAMSLVRARETTKMVASESLITLEP